MKYGGGMNEVPNPSDLTVAQWALIEPLLPAPKPKGRKRRVDLRKITNASSDSSSMPEKSLHVFLVKVILQNVFVFSVGNNPVSSSARNT